MGQLWSKLSILPAYSPSDVEKGPIYSDEAASDSDGATSFDLEAKVVKEPEEARRQQPVDDLAEKYETLANQHLDSLLFVCEYEIHPIFSWGIYDKLQRLHTLECYVIADRLPKDLHPACAVLLAKGYMDVALEWIEKWEELEGRWGKLLGPKVHPRTAVCASWASYLCLIAENYLALGCGPTYANTENSHWKLERMACFYKDNKYLFEMLLLIKDHFHGYCDDWLLDVEEKVIQRQGQLITDLMKLQIPEKIVSVKGKVAYLHQSASDRNLPLFREFYGTQELDQFRQTWTENVLEIKCQTNLTHFLRRMVRDDYLHISNRVKQKFNMIMDMMVDIVKLEIYCSDYVKDFQLKQCISRGLASEDTLSVICERFEHEPSVTVKDLWGKIFVKVIKVLTEDEDDDEKDDDSNYGDKERKTRAQSAIQV